MTTKLSQPSSIWADPSLATAPEQPLKSVGAYSERTTPAGQVRPHWQWLSQQLDQLGPDELSRRSAAIADIIRENGVTFRSAATNDSAAEINRPWQLSVIPFVIPIQQWDPIAAGLQQRARLLQRILADLHGPQRLIREGVIPGELLWRNPYYYRAFQGLAGAQPQLHLSAVDLARGADGNWYATGDRTRAPSGLGYLLENRVVTGRVMSGLIRRSNTVRLASFFDRFKSHLRSLASQSDNPWIGIMTPPRGSYRGFEDTYLARYLGLPLVQSEDLAVRGGSLYLKTLGGLQSIDVLWRHVSDRLCDPLELAGDSNQGVTGLLRCLRRGSVAVANAVGSSLAQCPGMMAYLDAASEFFDGNPLQLKSQQTLWCGDPNDFQQVLADPHQWVFRNAFRVSSDLPVCLQDLDAAQAENFLGQLRKHPQSYIAQRVASFSLTPVWSDNRIKQRAMVLRSFQLHEKDSINVLPGALARVGENTLELTTSPVSGHLTLDCWVTNDQPVGTHQSLLHDSKTPVQIRRVGDELPSRVAEHLFWLGRYAERSESIARVMRTTMDLIAGEDDWVNLPAVPRLIRQLAVQGQIEPGFAVDSLAATLPDIEQMLPASLLDRDQALGLVRSMGAVIGSTIAVRDRLSSEAFRIAQRAYRDLTHSPSAHPTGSVPKIQISEAIERVERLIVDLLALAGLTSESLVRSHVWQFVELGRRIERADQTSELLRQTLVPATDQGKSICEAVLRVTDSLMTYRARYLNLMRLAPVIDLLVTDPTNPRSLCFQLQQTLKVIDLLPTRQAAGTDDLLRSLAENLLQQVADADPMQLAEVAEDGTLNHLDALLEICSRELPKLSEALVARYLIHTSPRQLLTGSQR